MLNSEQKKAINLTNGRILVLAGAGSGKTKVLTHRIAHLIKDLRIEPSSILGLTFTNKAANEMKNRLKDLVGQKKSSDVFLSTFHSFGLTILRKEAAKLGYGINFSIYDEKDMQRMITQLAKDILKEDKNLPSITAIIETISDIKNKNIPLDEYSFEDKQMKSLMKELYPRALSSLKTYNAVDLDSMLPLTLELFEKHPNVLKKYQEKFKYVLIDEYQDTNPVQYKIAENISQKHNNLFVVGDDDQSIYGWRGSDIKHILEFKSDHVVKLEQNYRSTSIILHAANSVIKNNKQRHNKTLFSKNISHDPIVLFHAPSELEEVQAVINRAIALKKSKNLKWGNIAILYRSNSLSRNIEMALLGAMWQKDGQWFRSIPYDIYGGIEFAKRAEIKDLLAYLRVISNQKDTEALLRIINIPRRGISDKTIAAVANLSKKNKNSMWDILQAIHQDKIDLNIDLPLQSRAVNSIKNFVEIIQDAKRRFSKNKLSEAFEWLIHQINYKKAIEDDVKSERARLMKWENTLECINATRQYEESVKNPNLNDFISNTLLLKDNLYKKQSSSEDRIQLMTFHSSKGLEFEACFLIALEDHIIPHEKSSMQTSIEEERRLLYVGMTRAKKYLTLSMSRTRRKTTKSQPSNPSRFLFEIPKELLKISSWKSNQ